MVSYGTQLITGALTPYPDQLPADVYGLTPGAALTSLLGSVAGRDLARVDVVILGDSITEGEGAPSWAATLVQNANRAVRAAYPTTANGSKGGQGFIPVFSTGETSFTWPWTLVSGAPGTLDLGPVRGCLFTSAACSVSYTAPAGTTSVQVMYYDGSPGTNGTFSLSKNGGAATNFSNGMTSVDKLTTSVTMTSGDVLTVAWVSGTIAVDGLIHYSGDETSGITFHDAGHYGWDAGPGAAGWTQPETFALNWAQVYANGFPTVPACIIIYLGANDANSYTPAQFQTNLGTLIALIRAQTGLASVPVWLVAGYADQATPLSPAGWAPYTAAVRNVAAATSFSHVTDLSFRYPAVAFQGGAYYFNAGVGALGGHPSALGHRLIGEILAAGMRIS